MKRIINNIYHFFKLRMTLQPFDIYKECKCKRSESGGYWIGYDKKVYYGRKWLPIKSSQKSFTGNFIKH